MILDCRQNIDAGFFEKSINVGLNTPFAVWVGTLINPHDPLILLADEGKEEEAALRLSRIGFDHFIGFI